MIKVSIPKAEDLERVSNHDTRQRMITPDTAVDTDIDYDLRYVLKRM